MNHRGVRLALSLSLSLCASTSYASYCTQTDVATLTNTAYTSHWNAYDGLACLEEHFIAAGDRRALFASVYTLTTLRMAQSIDAGDYSNTSWMRSYQTRFANYYREALHEYVLGHRSQVPNAWLKAFDAAQSGQSLIIQDILLGMNAHINFDLPFAIEAVKISPNTTSRYLDHTRVNTVLAEVGDTITTALAGLYGTQYAALDQAMGPLDELFLATGMATARQTAWNNAVLLTGTSFWNRWVVVGGIDAAAVLNANLVNALTLSPSLRASLAALEGSNPGSTFCQNFPCSY